MADLTISMTTPEALAGWMIAGQALNRGWGNLPRSISWDEDSKDAVSDLWASGLGDVELASELGLYEYAYRENQATDEADADSKLVDIRTWVQEQIAGELTKSARNAKSKFAEAAALRQAEADKKAGLDSIKNLEPVISIA